MESVRFRLWFYGFSSFASIGNTLWFLYVDNLALYMVCGIFAVKNIDSLIDAMVAYQRKRFNR